MKTYILKYLQDEVGSKVTVTESSDFVQDLSIDGDDVDDIFSALFKKYPLKVDDEDWSDYFHSEGELIDITRIFKNIGCKPHSRGIGKNIGSPGQIFFQDFILNGAVDETFAAPGHPGNHMVGSAGNGLGKKRSFCRVDIKL